MHRVRARLALGLALAAIAARPDGVHGAPAPKGTVRVIRVGAPPVEGVLVRASPTEIVLEGAPAPIDTASVREVRFAPNAPPRPLPERSTGVRVVLRGGETIRGALVGASADDVTVRPPDYAPIRIPFDALRRIEAESPDRTPCEEPGRAHAARPGTDIAYIRSGDAYAGTVVSADETSVVVEGTGSKQTVAWTDVVVLHVDEPELPPAKGVIAEVETVGGSLLVGADVTGAADGVRLTLRSGPKVVVPREAIVAIRYSGGAFDLLGDLPFTSVWTPEYADSELSKTWYGTPRVDRTSDGCPLRIGKVLYRHGLSVHATTAVTVRLDRRYATFQASFGIDDEVLVLGDGPGPRGDVTARVLVDGKEAWSSNGSVRGGEAARVVGPLDVTGASELVLEVDSGSGSGKHARDRADWAEPLLLRAK